MINIPKTVLQSQVANFMTLSNDDENKLTIQTPSGTKNTIGDPDNNTNVEIFPHESWLEYFGYRVPYKASPLIRNLVYSAINTGTLIHSALPTGAEAYNEYGALIRASTTTPYGGATAYLSRVFLSPGHAFVITGYIRAPYIGVDGSYILISFLSHNTPTDASNAVNSAGIRIDGSNSKAYSTASSITTDSPTFTAATGVRFTAEVAVNSDGSRIDFRYSENNVVVMRETITTNIPLSVAMSACICAISAGTYSVDPDIQIVYVDYVGTGSLKGYERKFGTPLF